MRNIFTVDVEDWFHIPEIPSAGSAATWDRFESRVERNFGNLLDLLDKHGVKATCFVLGWVAERFPRLVRDAAARGHELASHGYGHCLIRSQTRSEFAADIRRAKDIVEQATGQAVLGYRAPAFSITRSTPWAFDEIAGAGFRYDASVFPARRDQGGLRGAPRAPYVLQTKHGPLTELPMSVVRLGRRDICFFGGGYLRLFPYFLVHRMAARVNAEGRPVVYYIHPRELDPGQPRLEMPRLKKLKVYVNLDTVEAKLRRLFEDEDLTTCSGWLADHQASLTTQAA